MEVSKGTVAALLVLVLVISFVGTWYMMGTINDKPVSQPTQVKTSNPVGNAQIDLTVNKQYEYGTGKIGLTIAK